MKMTYSLKTNREAIIEKLAFMSQHRNNYRNDKEHLLLDIQFRKGDPVIRFSSGRLSSYWDITFDEKQMKIKRRFFVSDILSIIVLGSIDLYVLFLTRNIAGLCLFLILVIFEAGPFYLAERYYVQKKIKNFVSHYLSDDIIL